MRGKYVPVGQLGQKANGAPSPKGPSPPQAKGYVAFKDTGKLQAAASGDQQDGAPLLAQPQGSAASAPEPAPAAPMAQDEALLRVEPPTSAASGQEGKEPGDPDAKGCVDDLHDGAEASLDDDGGYISDSAMNSIPGDQRAKLDRVLQYNVVISPTEQEPKEAAGDQAQMPLDIRGPLKRAHMVLGMSAIANSETLLEREVLKEVIVEDHRRWGGCIMMPITVLFFLFYSMAATAHEDVTYTHLMNKPILDQLREPLGEITTVSDVWDFFQTTYLPFFFEQTDYNGRPIPKERWSIVGQYSKLVGTVELELQRANEQDCAAEALHIKCYPAGSVVSEKFGLNISDLPEIPPTQGQTWTYYDQSSAATSILHCEDEGFTTTGCSSGRRLSGYKLSDTLIGMKLPMVKGKEPHYGFGFNASAPYEQIKLRLQYLKDRSWIDAQASTLKAKAVMLNTQLNGPRLQLVTTTFFFSRGGGVFTSLKSEAIPLDFFVQPLCYVADACFVVTLFVTSFAIVHQFVKELRKKFMMAYAEEDKTSLFKTFLLEHLNGVNILTWLSCLVGWGNIIGMIYAETHRSVVRKQLQAYLADPTEDASATLYELMEHTTYLVGMVRTVIADAHLLFMLRCFAALQWQPRLSVVAQTLMECSSDLFHYLIVLFTTMLSVAISGMVIFGRRLPEFATVTSSFKTCFKIAMESEFEWKRLSEKDHVVGFIWVACYLLMVVMLMVNMALAIIMDNYQKVRMDSGNTMTIFEHLAYMRRKIRYRKEWISEEVLMDQVSEMPRAILLADFTLAFPEMHKTQLEYLVEQCRNKSKRIMRVGIDKVYTAQMIAAIHLGLDEVSQNLQSLKKQGWMAKGVEVGTDEDRETVKEVFSNIAAQTHWMSLAAKQISTLELRMRGVSKEEEEARRRTARTFAGRTRRLAPTRATASSPTKYFSLSMDNIKR